MTSFTRAKLAATAEAEAKKQLVWSPGSEADKYKQKFWPVFGKGAWSWCGAFTTWCCEQAGLDIPMNCPSKFGYTFALVEGWQQWAEEKGFYHDNDGVYKPELGDISIFDWTQTNINDPDNNWDSHVAIFLRMQGASYQSAEGNTGNQTNLKLRSSVNIQGWIKIPDGYSFATAPSPINPNPIPILAYGAKGDDVGNLQSMLTVFSKKFYPGSVDNTFGSATTTALSNFQKAMGLPATGSTDEKTWAILKSWA